MKNDEIEVVSKIAGSWKKVKSEVTGGGSTGNEQKTGTPCVPVSCQSETEGSIGTDVLLVMP
jgi:hypothetical protein